jgi:hypothetical protein
MTTMEFRVMRNERSEWAAIEGSVSKAGNNYWRILATDYFVDDDRWHAATTGLTEALVAAATFVSSDPVIRKKKRTMATQFMEFAARYDASWLEDMADLINASTGAVPTELYNVRPTSTELAVSWAPAKLFWHCLDNYDERFVEATAGAQATDPADQYELGEKIRIAAVLALMSMSLKLYGRRENIEAPYGKWESSIRRAPAATLCQSLSDMQADQQGESSSNLVQRNGDIGTADILKVVMLFISREWQSVLENDAKALSPVRLTMLPSATSPA